MCKIYYKQRIHEGYSKSSEHCGKSLRNGLNFGVQDARRVLDDVITHVGNGIQEMPKSLKGLIREIIKNKFS